MASGSPAKPSYESVNGPVPSGPPVDEHGLAQQTCGLAVGPTKEQARPMVHMVLRLRGRPPPTTMTLEIRAWTGKVYHLVIERKSTLEGLKDSIARKLVEEDKTLLNLSQELILFHRGRKLTRGEDDEGKDGKSDEKVKEASRSRTLLEHGIRPYSVIYAFPKSGEESELVARKLGGQKTVIKCPTTATVGFAKEVIKSQLDSNRMKVELFVKSNRLEESKKLKDCGLLEKGAEVNVILTKAKEMEICVKTLSGKTYVFSVPVEGKVIRLKELIRDKSGVPEEQQRLIFAGRHMEDSRNFHDYNIAPPPPVLKASILPPNGSSPPHAPKTMKDLPKPVVHMVS